MLVIARRLPAVRVFAVAVGLTALCACGSKKDDGKASAPPAKEAAPQPAQAAAPPPGAQVAQPGGAGAVMPPAADAPGRAPAAGRSAVPTTEEWNGVPEVTVLGSSALECETKQVREWIRVSCRGDAPGRGKPTSVKVERGGGAETFVFASGGVASLVFPFEVGTDVQALFQWEKQQHLLVSQWPRGAPKPTAYGKFGPA
jgi:hypothetical protein